MKKYLLFLFSLLINCGLFSQDLTQLTHKQAKKLALMRNYNSWETANFLAKATSLGINLKPEYYIPTVRQSNSVSNMAYNLDFEAQNFVGWTGKYTSSNCTSPTPNTATTFSIDFSTLNNTSDFIGLCTIGNDPTVLSGVLPCVNPLSGGLASCRLGDINDGCSSSYLSQSFTVSMPDTQLILYFALVLYDGHPVGDAPKFGYIISDPSGAVIHSLKMDATQGAGGANGWMGAGNGNTLMYYRPWDADTFSLTNYVGQNITIDLYSSDCNGGAHRGYAYIDFNGMGSTVVNNCGWLNPTNVCFVTTDDNFDNEIFFNHSTTSVPQQGTIIYRKNGSGGWDSLTTIPVSQPDKFIDTTAVAGTSYTYCVQSTDSCATPYAKTPGHGTIALNSSMNGTGQIVLTWTPYTGLPASNYKIYRGLSPTTLSYVTQTSATTYTDVNPPLGTYFYKIVRGPSVNCTSNASPDTAIQSNYVSEIITCNNSVSQPASLCFITANDSLHNEIFFAHNGGGLMGTIVYRQNSLSQWDSIGFVPSSQTDHFIDLGVSPNQQSYIYCVESVDSCGNLHGKSAAHTTILLQTNLGTNSTVNLSWNAYVGTPVSSYYIYRGVTQSNLNYLNQVSSSTFAYTDLNPPQGSVYYRINFVAPSCTSNEPHGPLAGSNYKVNNVVGIAQFNSVSLLSVYPSPAKDILYIESSLNTAEFMITDIVGNVVKQVSQKSGKNGIDIKNLSNGVYFVTMKDAETKTTVIRKFVVQN